SGFAFINFLNAGVNVARVSYKSVNATTKQVLLAVNQGVTPVKLDDFHAEIQGAGVMLGWNAISEYQNLGFNLYRRDIAGETWARINPALIAGRITNPDEKKYTF